MNIFNKKANILILGANGMLGHDVYEAFKQKSQQKNTHIGTVIGLDIEDGIDVCTTSNQLTRYFETSIHYDYCINCIAYTNTNSAQTTADGHDLDYQLNVLAPKHIAQACIANKTRMIHISTDYVFSEKSFINGITGLVNTIDTTPFPVNVYGEHKLLGELYVKEEFANANQPKSYAILRTSWLYGMHNSKSFVHKFLKNVKKCLAENREIEMTTNEVSVPTSTAYVTECIATVINQKMYGLQHAVPSVPERRGVSRYKFATEILSNLCSVLHTDEFDVMLNGVDRNSYWPKLSAMKSTFEDLKESRSTSYSWQTDLHDFILNNKDELVKFMNA